MKRILPVAALLLCSFAEATTVTLTRAEYRDRVEAIWLAQIIAVKVAWPHEHKVASTQWLDKYPKHYDHAVVDDDWYYEMCAVRAFEKYGINMKAEQLGEQWLENACGSWGSSQQALENLKRGIKAPDCGHPRYNRLWFTIGPQFSAEVYGAIAPALPNVAAGMAREFGHVNGYAEAVDGAVFMAGMVSLGFVASDPKTIVRKAARLIHPSSPYRQCLDELIARAESGESFEQIVAAVENRWHIEYPATNNAVANGGIVAAGVWFGEGNFLKTINLIARAADFTDADCNAANAAAVVGAMHGMKALPSELVAQLHDRILGDEMGGVKLTPPVDEHISDLAARTVAIGEKVLAANGVRSNGDQLVIAASEPQTQAAERFTLPDLMNYWNSEWTLERAGFGGAGGGMPGIRGITYLSGDVLATYPRDETRGALLRRRAKLGMQPAFDCQVGSAPNRAWELSVYADNKELLKQLIVGGTGTDLNWQPIHVDLAQFANTEVTLRLYQRVLIPVRLPGNAYWKELTLH
jgi:hypothetical protein